MIRHKRHNVDGAPPKTFEADLEALNDRNGRAQHIHIGGNNEWPDEAASGDEEFFTTAESQPAYGPVMVSLTTTGDVGAASGLAVDRFPVSENGTIPDERTFDCPMASPPRTAPTA